MINEEKCPHECILVEFSFVIKSFSPQVYPTASPLGENISHLYDFKLIHISVQSLQFCVQYYNIFDHVKMGPDHILMY